MGCDIHIFTEMKGAPYAEHEGWFNCDNWRVNQYYEPGNEEETGEYHEFRVHSICGGRHYELFAVLADVRNYGSIEYIADPRGLPADVTKEVQKESDYWDGDGHSHSYFTLGELKRFRDKSDGKIKRSGMVDPETAKALDESGEEPQSWCQWCSDKSYQHREWVVEESPLDDLIEAVEERMIDVFWLKYREKEEIKEYEDRIRIVFWFDN